MRLHTKEFADLTGVSVRTLHYYDEIGLLKPCSVDPQNGYRYYDETSLARMQEILFYRELDFSLNSIAEILTSPNYDKRKALAGQKNLLILKRDRLNRLIGAIDSAMEGEKVMKAFDNSEYESAKKQYEKEARERWGDTDAYREYSEKTKNYTKKKWDSVTSEMMEIFAEFAACRNSGAQPDSVEAQALAAKLQAHITANCYNCTKEILAGLGQMYIADERFRKNIDKHGEGTAQFAADAIVVYCK